VPSAVADVSIVAPSCCASALRFVARNLSYVLVPVGVLLLAHLAAFGVGRRSPGTFDRIDVSKIELSPRLVLG
jgi:hypothetical protein